VRGLNFVKKKRSPPAQSEGVGSKLGEHLIIRCKPETTNEEGWKTERKGFKYRKEPGIHRDLHKICTVL